MYLHSVFITRVSYVLCGKRSIIIGPLFSIHEATDSREYKANEKL